MQKLRILIVEDETAHLNMFRECINRSLYINKNFTSEIVSAATYNEALAILHEQVKFDISILDHKLPGEKTGKDLFGKNQLLLEKFGQVIFTTQDDVQARKYSDFKDIGNYLQLSKPPYISQLEKVFEESVRNNFLKNRTFNTPLVLKRGTGYKEIYNRYDIAFIKSNGKLCDYYLFQNDKIILYDKVVGGLSEHSEQLKETDLFLRVHDKYLVNILRIKYGDKYKNPITRKYSRKHGWLSFVPHGNSSNSATADYSRTYPTFNQLKAITRMDWL